MKYCVLFTAHQFPWGSGNVLFFCSSNPQASQAYCDIYLREVVAAYISNRQHYTEFTLYMLMTDRAKTIRNVFIHHLFATRELDSEQKNFPETIKQEGSKKNSNCLVEICIVLNIVKSDNFVKGTCKRQIGNRRQTSQLFVM